MRQRLAQAGVRFRTDTDTEVILELYLERGLDFVDRLRGMYAVAIFDWRQTRPEALPRLVLARGPLGIKPLYAAAPAGDPEGLIFASEVRGLLASGLIPRRVDPEGLAEFLADGFVIEPRTIIAGIRMIPPGSIEVYSPDRAVERRVFWTTPRYAPRDETLDEAAERLRGVLDESVKLHAFADAPVGAFLSGGVDSTGIVGLMREHVSDLRTYTIRCPDVMHQDESAFAAATAAAFGCRNTVVEITGREIANLLPRFAADVDQPSSDGLNTWLISRAAGRDVKAVLSGIGGDEWFAGYPVTRRMAYANGRLSGRLLKIAGHAAQGIAPWIPEGKLRSRALDLAARRSPLAIWLHAHRMFRYRAARRAVGLPAGPVSQEEWFYDYLRSVGDDVARETPVGLSCLLDFQIYMGNQLLRDSDAMSMAHSLELRTPLLDLAVVEFSRTCRDEYKLNLRGSGNRYGQSGAKQVLIRALGDVLPADMSRRPKLGFALPYGQWLGGALQPLVAEVCDPKAVAARGLIDPALVAPLVRSGESSGADVQLRGLVLLELWCRNVLDAAHSGRLPRVVVSTRAPLLVGRRDRLGRQIGPRRRPPSRAAKALLAGCRGDLR